MEIVSLKRESLEDLLSLYIHLHAKDEYCDDFSEYEKTWHEIDKQKNIQYFGAYENDILVSSCTITVIPNLTRACRPYSLIENVVTHSEYRRRGLATAVIKHALEFSWSCGCYKSMLLTGRKSEAVTNFYARAGFDGDSKNAFIAKPKNT